MKLPQVSLREIFLTIAALAMGCGWLASEMRWREHDQRLARRAWLAEKLIGQMRVALETNGHEVAGMVDELFIRTPPIPARPAHED